MKLTLGNYLKEFRHFLQTSLFPRIEEEIGELGARARLLVQILAMAPLSPWLQRPTGPGRPCQDRHNLAAAFLAKAVFNCVTTRQLIELLASSTQLRRLCGWNAVSDLPHESTFSRAFAEFAQSQLPQLLHQALITTTHGQRLVGHISRDSTAIEARERFPEPPPKPVEKMKKYKKRPKRAQAKDRGTEIERQRKMPLEQMLAGLSTDSAIGVKKSSKGHTVRPHGLGL